MKAINVLKEKINGAENNVVSLAKSYTENNWNKMFKDGSRYYLGNDENSICFAQVQDLLPEIALEFGFDEADKTRAPRNKNASRPTSSATRVVSRDIDFDVKDVSQIFTGLADVEYHLNTAMMKISKMQEFVKNLRAEMAAHDNEETEQEDAHPSVAEEEIVNENATERAEMESESESNDDAVIDETPTDDEEVVPEPQQEPVEAEHVAVEEAPVEESASETEETNGFESHDYINEDNKIETKKRGRKPKKSATIVEEHTQVVEHIVETEEPSSEEAYEEELNETLGMPTPKNRKEYADEIVSILEHNEVKVMTFAGDRVCFTSGSCGAEIESIEVKKNKLTLNLLCISGRTEGKRTSAPYDNQFVTDETIVELYNLVKKSELPF